MIELAAFYHSLTDDEKRKIKEAEKEICEFIHDYVNVRRSEMYRMLVDGGNVPHWCFYKILQYLEDNGEIQSEPIYEIKDYEITHKRRKNNGIRYGNKTYNR